jgi:hypothetical protein
LHKSPMARLTTYIIISILYNKKIATVDILLSAQKPIYLFSHFRNRYWF